MAPKQDWLEKDFYRTLNVDNDASDKEIQKSYRKLARKYHPDANPDDKAAEDKFKQISEAYEILGSEDTRREYDSFRKHGPTSFGFGGAGSAGGHARSSGPTGFEAGDFSDIFSDLFGGQSQQSKRQGAGQDLEADLSISFIDAVRGTQTKITINTEVACKNCSGTGAAAGTTPDLCRVCHGRGSQSNDQGFFAVSQPCANCQGRGMVIENPCGNCSGTGSNRKPRTITVKIPPGVTDGQRIRLRGKGAAGRNGAPSGNLYINLKVGNHQMYSRSGNDLTFKLPISFAEAALGSNVKVPLLEGGTVTLKVPEGTSSGKTFRVKGKGVTSGSSQGDLLVTVVIDVPTNLTEDQRMAIAELESSLQSTSDSRAG